MRKTSKRVGLIAGSVLGLLVLVALLSPWLTPYAPNEQNLGAALLPPLSPGHILGTDELGRDVLTRLMAGGRPILMVAFVSTSLAMTAGVLVGLVSGFRGGVLDTILMRLVDIQLSVPPIALAVLLAAIIGPGMRAAMVAIPLVTWPQIARVVRSDVMRVASADFVALARVAGLSERRILFRHVAPNVMTVVIVIGTLNLGVAVIYSAAMSFLGLGVQAPRADWGNMLAGGTQYLSSWWLVVLPGAMLTIVVLCMTLLGDALRDRLDPRRSGSGSTKMDATTKAGV